MLDLWEGNLFRPHATYGGFHQRSEKKVRDYSLTMNGIGHSFMSSSFLRSARVSNSSVSIMCCFMSTNALKQFAQLFLVTSSIILEILVAESTLKPVAYFAMAIYFMCKDVLRLVLMIVNHQLIKTEDHESR